ncbi:MAG: tRNA (adenosine(37)-N6)-threonylcarbamoyltransferase complex transferase subunit TsaD [Candidatus Aminicenantaceae bacterium]
MKKKKAGSFSSMNILGIETSCDETAASVVRGDFEILSNVVLSQDEIHAPFGGVVPELASRQHLTFIGYVVEESLNRAKVGLGEIDVYAVTQGPGLIGSLLVGLSFAKGLTYYFEKPLMAIDHLEAHIQSALLETQNIPFPALALVVSGGHTSLFFMKRKLDFELIGKTRDDAAGEALDKIAKFLDLGYPGGPIIDKLAEKGDSQKFTFGLPHMTDRSLDFSFSGLKTAALKKIKEFEITKSHPEFFDFLASFENSIIRALLANMAQAIRVHKPKSLILCGGVARNKKLRQHFTEFAQKHRLVFSIPSPEFCTDNAAMVAALALEKLKSGEKPSFAPDLNAYPRRNQ